MRKGEKTRVTFDPQMAAQVLTDAKFLGSDKAAADKWNVTERTVRRYRARLQSADDPQLSHEVLRLEKDTLAGWGLARVKALNACMKRAEELIPGITSLSELSQFAERVGGVDVTIKALGGDSSSPPTESAGPAEDAGGTREGPGEE